MSTQTRAASRSTRSDQHREQKIGLPETVVSGLRCQVWRLDTAAKHTQGDQAGIECFAIAREDWKRPYHGGMLKHTA